MPLLCLWPLRNLSPFTRRLGRVDASLNGTRLTLLLFLTRERKRGTFKIGRHLAAFESRVAGISVRSEGALVGQALDRRAVRGVGTDLQRQLCESVRSGRQRRASAQSDCSSEFTASDGVQWRVGKPGVLQLALTFQTDKADAELRPRVTISRPANVFVYGSIDIEINYHR